MLFIFSFFYVSKAKEYISYNSSLLTNINSVKDFYATPSVDAVISGEYIIPGIDGKEVNVLDSYYNLTNSTTFNESLLVFDEITPQVSVNDNLDKYISSGNPLVRSVAIIIDNNPNVEAYILENNITASKLVTYSEFDSSISIEQINNETTYFTLLKKLIDNKVCVVNDYNIDICKNFSYFLIKPNITVTNANYVSVKNSLTSGQILYIDNDLYLEYFVSIIKEISFKAYNLYTLSQLVSE